MSIPFDSQCMECHLRRNCATARSLGTARQATEFAKELMKLYLSAPEGVASPWFGPTTTDLFQKFYNLPEDRFREEKEASNRFVMERLPQIRARVEQADDPVFAGLQYAILGNYIDFSALQGQVSFEKLEALLEEGEKMELDRAVYEALCEDCRKGSRLLYLTDNAGEIGFDRVFAEALAQKYPHLAITFCVRGAPAMNDATREDAALVGIPFPVIDNGNRVAGTQLELLGEAADRAIKTADVILAKGQGNAETMFGCGYNVYYAFLIKCPRFEDVFGKPKFTPMLVRDPK